MHTPVRLRYREPVLLMAVLLAVGGRSPAEPHVEPGAVQADLLQYYREGKVPDWRGALDRMASTDAEAASQAALTLRTLLDQALKDELSGGAPWRPTPYWGSSGENPDRELRKDIADALEQADGMPAALPVCQWFLDHAWLVNLQPKAAAALLKIKTKDADEHILQIISSRHPNRMVLQVVLEEAGKRRLSIPEGVLTELCQDHRTGVRTAARPSTCRGVGPRRSCPASARR